jgi:hypothetical protein
MMPPANNDPARGLGQCKPSPAVAKLLHAKAVRERCAIVHHWVAENRSAHFVLDSAELERAADLVAEATRENYPDLQIPLHSRWRHFCVDGVDRSRELLSAAPEPREQARLAIDLATVSVLLDAGAGDAWSYQEKTSGRSFARSEALAIASLEMFRAGAFSSDRAHPLRADALALAQIDAPTLAHHFQVGPANPLIGLKRRSELLRRLGGAIAKQPGFFGADPARPGNLLDYFSSIARAGAISAGTMLSTLLEAFASIWPSGFMLNGFCIGDAGRHCAGRAADETEGIVPFHKLSQWLAYSLIEPLAIASLKVERIDELTALPEYRNGGLLIDAGAIRPRAVIDRQRPYAVGSELVVEWRALTVALMDRLIDLVRARLGLGDEFTMPHMLQGGSWSAGRRIARALRPPDGPPPIPIIADGTVF